VEIGGGYTEFAGFPENHWVPWLIHKAKTEEPKTVLQQCQTGLTGGDWSDRCATTQSGIFEAEDTRWDRKACDGAKQVCCALGGISSIPPFWTSFGRIKFGYGLLIRCS
jgi:hypothetical protein